MNCFFDFRLSVFLFFGLGFSSGMLSQTVDFAKYVNPFVGTGGHGHTFPGATTPFGMVQLSPDTRIDGSWDGCGGYHYSDSVLYGFSHTHLSGTGVSDYGDILLLPTAKTTGGGAPAKRLSAKFSHKNEKASPGFYAVRLDEENIEVELSSSARVGMHKYTFPVSGRITIILDLDHRDKLLESKVNFISKKKIEGVRRSEGWARDQFVAFGMEFSKDYAGYTIEYHHEGRSMEDSLVRVHFYFDVEAGKPLCIKVALSPVSPGGAWKNMKTEVPHWDFEKVKSDARDLWNKELGKIEVTTGNKTHLENFYTALYHCMIAPNIAMDVDGNYRGMDKKIHMAEGFDYYTVFSLWDTFRALHPLLTIIDQKRTNDFINTFLKMYEQGGRLPVWELASNETDCMIGYHSVSVITDAFIKGIKSFDQELALKAMMKSATWDHYGIPAYMDHGYLSIEDEHESVSKTLEYAYDDWCIHLFSSFTTLNHDATSGYYERRAQSWKNLFDPVHGFMKPRKNGGWLKPFDPREVNNHYTEANSWQYSFFVPQDIEGLIFSMKGPSFLEQKLDELFTTDSKTTGRQQADITGLIGQYAHGNEPSHHIAYLYNYTGKSWKTQQRVREIMERFYTPTPDGLCGNEDCGQMSAWYVFSAMGFYPVTPGLPRYDIGSPLFDRVKIHLENGKTFTLVAKGNSSTAKFVQRSPSYFKTFISHEDILKGTTITLQMGEKPETPPEDGSRELFDLGSAIPSPLILSDGMTFRDSTLVNLQSLYPGAKLLYALENEAFQPYKKPVTISSSMKIKAKAWYVFSKDTVYSSVTTAFFHKIPHNWKVTIVSKYTPQYNAGGDEGIIDGLYGDYNWRKGGWQGYQGQDFEAVIDLGKSMPVNEVYANFLQDTRSWIIAPRKVMFYYSENGKDFKSYGEVVTNMAPDNYTVSINNMKSDLKPVPTARYIKVVAKNFGKLPEWHQGAGGDAYIFVDEIGVR